MYRSVKRLHVSVNISVIRTKLENLDDIIKIAVSISINSPQ